MISDYNEEGMIDNQLNELMCVYMKRNATNVRKSVFNVGNVNNNI